MHTLLMKYIYLHRVTTNKVSMIPFHQKIYFKTVIQYGELISTGLYIF